VTLIEDMTVAVLPGTGKTGRRIAQRLRDAGAAVRAGPRRGTPPSDRTKQATWRVHLEGEDDACVTHIPDLAVLAHLFGELLDGRNAEPQGGVEVVLGRQPADAATAMSRAAQAGAST